MRGVRLIGATKAVDMKVRIRGVCGHRVRTPPSPQLTGTGLDIKLEKPQAANVLRKNAGAVGRMLAEHGIVG